MGIVKTEVEDEAAGDDVGNNVNMNSMDRTQPIILHSDTVESGDARKAIDNGNLDASRTNTNTMAKQSPDSMLQAYIHLPQKSTPPRPTSSSVSRQHSTEDILPRSPSRTSRNDTSSNRLDNASKTQSSPTPQPHNADGALSTDRFTPLRRRIVPRKVDVTLVATIVPDGK